MVIGYFESMAKYLKADQPEKTAILEHHQDCTIVQQIGTEKVEYTGCKDVYVFMSGTVLVPGISSDMVLNSAAGPITITRTGKDPVPSFDFDEPGEI